MRRSLLLVQSAGLLLNIPAQAQGLSRTFLDNDTKTVEYGPFTTFRTEPTFFYHTPNITIQLQDTDDAAHYLFYSPRTLFTRQFGPHIIDQRDGSLVWYGNESMPGSGTMGVEPCDFSGDHSRMINSNYSLNSTLSSVASMKHLCINQVLSATVKDGLSGLLSSRHFALSLVLDYKYTIVLLAGEKEAGKEIESFTNPASTVLPWQCDDDIAGPHEPHDFHTLPGGKSYITLVECPIPWDLRRYAPPPNTHDAMLELRQGTVIDACFQVIPIPASARNVPLFSWCALDAYPDIDFWRPHVFFDNDSTKSKESDERYRDGAGGRGNEAWGWDLFHLTSVDTDGNGNYIISARHLDAVFLIAGQNSTTINPKTGLPWLAGQLIWRLNGVEGGDFDMVDATSELGTATSSVEPEVKREWGFGRQNHARYLASMSNDTHMMISLFDNGWTNRTQLENKTSSGLLISLTKARLNGSTHLTATLVNRYQHPHAEATAFWHSGTNVAAEKSAQIQDSGVGVSVSEGSAQVLANGNMLTGWGSVPEVTEFNRAGDPIWHMHFGPSNRHDELLSYRVAKAEWVGEPETAPKLVVYGTSCGSSTTDSASPLESVGFTAYVSWNGATEVANWKFFVKVDREILPSSLEPRTPFSLSWLSDDWIDVGSVPKQGFETSFGITADYMSQAPVGVLVEALDVDGRILATSDPVRVFVPLARLVAEGRCDKVGCICEEDDLEGCTTNGPTKHFIYSAKLSEECSTTPLISILTGSEDNRPASEDELVLEDELRLEDDLMLEDSSLEDASDWTDSNTGLQPAKRKFTLISSLCLLIGFMAVAFALAKFLGVTRATALHNLKSCFAMAKALIFVPVKTIGAVWHARLIERYHSISSADAS